MGTQDFLESVDFRAGLVLAGFLDKVDFQAGQVSAAIQDIPGLESQAIVDFLDILVRAVQQ